MTAASGAAGMEDGAVRPPDLMFDPSSLLDPVGLEQVIEAAQNEAVRANLFVPASFVRALNEPDQLQLVRRYFGRGHDAMADDILRRIRDVGLQPYVGEQTIGETDLVAQRLAQSRERIVRDILIEEWTFLVGHSWIAARRKKVFDVFKRSGAIIVDFSGHKFDAVVARTLHHHQIPVPPPLTNRLRIRAAAKWVAAGGGSLLGLVDPILGAVAGTSTGVFFLFDP